LATRLVRAGHWALLVSEGGALGTAEQSGHHPMPKRARTRKKDRPLEMETASRRQSAERSD
jgi:hypothetical protein